MKQSIILSTVASALVFTAVSAQAAGFQLSEYSASGMGRSFAGAGVVGDDFSAIGFNPAGMSLNKTSGVQAGVSMVSLHSDYKGDNGYGQVGEGHTRVTRLLPNGFMQYKLNDKATVGFGAYVPFGLATDYKNDWFGEMHGGLSHVSAANYSPAFSYQINDMISVGGALNFELIDARLTSKEGMISKNLRGDDWGVGYTLGVTVQPMKNLRLGASYRSKISHTLEGTVKLTTPLGSKGKHGINAKITLPETALFSGSYDVNDQWTVSASARWTRWSRFKDLDVRTTGNTIAPAGSPISLTHEHWKNTWFYALGADYKMNKNWTLRLGTAYDQTVVKAPEYRTARIPDGRRVWASFGASYTKGNIQVDAGYAHLFLHGGKANGGEEGKGKPDMKYSSDAEMLSLSVQYKF